MNYSPKETSGLVRRLFLTPFSMLQTALSRARNFGAQAVTEYGVTLGTRDQLRTYQTFVEKFGQPTSVHYLFPWDGTTIDASPVRVFDKVIFVDSNPKVINAVERMRYNGRRLSALKLSPDFENLRGPLTYIDLVIANSRGLITNPYDIRASDEKRVELHHINKILSRGHVITDGIGNPLPDRLRNETHYTELKGVFSKGNLIHLFKKEVVA